MSNKGYVKLYRQIQDCWIWTLDDKFSKGQAWVDILLSCNHADKKIPFNGEPVVIERGQWLTSILNLSNRWNWSRHKVSDFLHILEKDNMITVDKDTKRTLITVVNYSVYQDKDSEDGQQKDNARTSDGHQTDINKNEEECNKNDKEYMGNTPKKKFVPPTVEEVRSYCQERGNNVDPQSFIDFYESKGWMIGKNKMKDWKAAVRTWEKNDAKTPTQPKKESKFEKGMMKSNYDFSELEKELLGG